MSNFKAGRGDRGTGRATGELRHIPPPESNLSADFDDLERLAKAANSGPHHIYTNPRDDNNRKANEDFHAAASPDLILAFIAQVKDASPGSNEASK